MPLPLHVQESCTASTDAPGANSGASAATNSADAGTDTGTDSSTNAGAATNSGASAIVLLHS